MRVQRDGVVPFLSGNLYPLLFIDGASVVCGIILDVQYIYIYVHIYVYIYTRIYMKFFHIQGFSSILRQPVHCPLLTLLTFSASPLFGFGRFPLALSNTDEILGGSPLCVTT